MLVEAFQRTLSSFSRRSPHGNQVYPVNAGARGAISGATVSPDTAMQLSTVYRCITLLANSVAQIPLVLYKRGKDGRSKARATDHPLYPVLHDLFNEEQTSYQGREFMMGCAGLRGNGISQIRRGQTGEILDLWPLPVDRMRVERRDDALIYAYRPLQGAERIFSRREIWHVQGFGSNGITGVSPITYARESMGLALSTQEFGSRFYSNGAHVKGVLEHPKNLSAPAIERLKLQFQQGSTGVENASKPLVLEEGMKWSSIGLSNEDAQFLETRRFQVAEVCRWFGVPPHKVADLTNATFSNIEHQGIEFVVDSLMPWLRRIEQTISRDLLRPDERTTYFAEFLVDGLLRGDTASRFEAYGAAINAGWMSRNEAREKENLNPAEGLDKFLEPLNMVPAGEPHVKDAPKPTRGDVFEELAEQAVARCVRREASDLREALHKGIDLLAWSADAYTSGGKLRDYVTRNLGAVVKAAARAEGLERMAGALAGVAVARHAEASVARIARAVADGTIESEIAGWESSRSGELVKWLGGMHDELAA